MKLYCPVFNIKVIIKRRNVVDNIRYCSGSGNKRHSSVPQRRVGDNID